MLVCDFNIIHSSVALSLFDPDISDITTFSIVVKHFIFILADYIPKTFSWNHLAQVLEECIIKLWCFVFLYYQLNISTEDTNDFMSRCFTFMGSNVDVWVMLTCACNRGMLYFCAQIYVVFIFYWALHQNYNG